MDEQDKAMETDLKYIRRDLDRIMKLMETYTLKVEFVPVRMIAYGLVTAVLSGTVVLLMSLLYDKS